ncbi:LPXTG cell wall anchor domain-containing protein [Micromonospora sp. RL09-050-HVF-A]|uniref:LPXTG cell wall anchor domain-containing protein n=1 Tax=Micromonospora sp. RL09-050-HVF-A TaxID=1703433 RepID=UPI0027E31CC9|nr:LPXTG cell wall anchor domain-containing protein [Micromonospora sp. RL09-050-HVF-A]
MMLKHSTRRWLAGLSVAGAFVAASATPASAESAKVNLGIYFDDTTVALGSEGKTNSPTLHSSVPAVLRGLSVRYDFAGLSAKVTVKPESVGSGDCTSPQQGVLVCTDPFEVELDEWGIGGYFNVVIAPTADAQDGDSGDLKVTVSADGAKSASHTAKVRVGEGVDLAGGTEVTRSTAPGGSFTAPLTVQNVGQSTVKGAVAVFDHDRAIRPGKKYSNCTYEGDQLRTCSFTDLVAAPGESWTADAPYLLGKDAYAPGRSYGYHNWMTVAEFEDFTTYLAHLDISIGKPGDGGELSLGKGGNRRGLQSDTDPYNNWSSVVVKATGKNGTDLAAIGNSVKGKAGEVVNATIGVRNDGPASLDFSRSGTPVTKVDVVVPTGTTAVEVPDTCMPFDDGDADWSEAGTPGAKAYRCLPDTYLAVNEKQTFSFDLRIDKVVPDAAGTVTINAKCACDGFTEDTNAANDVTKLLVNATGPDGGTDGPGGGDGGAGAGDGGPLPITGSSTALVGGVGALLLVAGAAGYLVARRRRTRFVA